MIIPVNQIFEKEEVLWYEDGPGPDDPVSKMAKHKVLLYLNTNQIQSFYTSNEGRTFVTLIGESQNIEIEEKADYLTTQIEIRERRARHEREIMGAINCLETVAEQLAEMTDLMNSLVNLR